MSLQLALLFIGLVIVGAVVLTAFDKARANRHYKEARSQRSRIPGFAEQAAALVERALHPASRLDMNPGPLLGSNKRFLRSDAAIPELHTKAPDSSFYDALEGFEQAASMPLDVDLTLVDEIIDSDSDDEDAGEAGAPKASKASGPSMPDSDLDFIINLPGRGPVSRNKALGIYKQNEYLLEKPRALYGLRYIEGVWSNVDRDKENTQYSSLSLAIQIVDHKGPISESELNTFGQLGLKLADTLNRPSKLSATYEEVLARAKELDEFYKNFDAIASINIIPVNPKGFSGRVLQQAVESTGMRFGAMNIYHKKNEQAMGCRHMFSLANLHEPGEFDPNAFDTFRSQGLVLFMQIPCTYAPVKSFQEMVKTAQEISNALMGRLVDQEGEPLTDKGLLAISRQIEGMASEMQEFGITPGSETALRLFNS